MKRVLEFIICLLLVITVVYLKPPLTSHYQTKKNDDLEVEEVKISHKSVPYYELNTTGMANYIGMSEADFLKEFGEPKKTYHSYFSEKWLVYGDSIDNYFQVQITNNFVSSIVTLGNEIDSAPFSMGMNLTDLGEITTIFSNFNFEYNKEKYDVELSEDDMNYSPLVAFNNGTFAILHIDRGNGELIAVRYLDKRSLLMIMPYELTQENLVRETLSNDAIDWKQVNQDNRNQMLELLNILRNKEDQPSYKTSAKLQLAAHSGISLMKEKTATVITESERLNDFDAIRADENTIKTFSLETKEMNRLLEELKLNKKKTHGFFYYPVLDVPFIVTSMYSTQPYYNELTHDDDNTIGISFDGEMAMTLFDKQEKNSKTTESSE